ncbi:RNA-dependent RNA polymerase [Common carp toti-like virus 1]|uniref:RNA-directed RNA polymerase n=1 Tax=Common carp toti-like virus 1 TaxID=2855314 RepID=A0A8F5GJ18_9VIRU|nr:RNA-dependent RNA polymerase [Common carp toti-like virus 1]
MEFVCNFIKSRRLDPRLVFKKISSHAKLSGSSLSQNWKELVNWELLGGYQELSEAEMAEEVFKQVTIPAESSNNGYPVAKQLDKLLKPLHRTVKMETDFKTYLQMRDVWARGTSGFIGSDMRLGSTKTEIGVNASDEQVLKVSEQPIQNRPFIKPEPGKARPVVNSNMSCYLKMDYIWINIESVLRKAFGDKLTMFDSAEDKMKLWIDMAKDSMNWDTIKVPLDYSRFDSTIAKNLILRTLNLLLEMTDLSEEWKQDFLTDFNNQTVDIPGFGKVLWKNSVLSGWRFTALLDSLINLAILQASGALRSGMGVKVQGDDVKIAFTDIRHAEDVITNINDFGFEINPGKVFSSRKRDEYLRMVSEGDVTSGYLIRALPKIIFNSPQEDLGVEWDKKFSGLVDKWTRVESRGGNVNRCRYWMLRDLCGSSGWSKEEVKLWLHTPRTVGGAGIVPWGDKWMSLKYEGEDSPTYRGLDPAEMWKDEVTRRQKGKFILTPVDTIQPLGNWVQFTPGTKGRRVPRVNWKERNTPFQRQKFRIAVNHKEWDVAYSMVSNRDELELCKRELPRWLFMQVLDGTAKWVSMPTSIVNKEVGAVIAHFAEGMVYSKICKYKGIRGKDSLNRFKLGAEIWINGTLTQYMNILQ